MSIKNIALTFSGAGIPLIAAVLSIPTIRAYCSPDDFSALVICWTLIGYLGLLDLGISRAMTYFASLYKREKNEIGIGILAINGLLLGTIIFIIICTASEIAQIFLKDTIVVDIRLFVVLVGISIILNIFRGFIDGLEYFGTSALIKSITHASLFAIPIILIKIGFWSLNFTLTLYLLSRLFCLFIVLFRLYIGNLHHHSPKIIISQYHFKSIKTFIRYGSGTFISSIVGPLMVYGDRFVINLFLGPVALSSYFVIQEAITKTLILSSSIFTVYQPKFTMNGEEWVAHNFRKLELKLTLLFLLFYSLVSIYFHHLVSWWIGDSIENLQSLIFIFSIGLFFNSIAQMSNSVLLGFGRSEVVARIHIFELVIYIPILLLLLIKFGLIGAALAWAIRSFIDLILLRLLAFRHLSEYCIRV